MEKSLLARIEMSLSTVSVGEHWADDGDCDEPDGDRSDERVARSGEKCVVTDVEDRSSLELAGGKDTLLISYTKNASWFDPGCVKTRCWK